MSTLGLKLRSFEKIMSCNNDIDKNVKIVMQTGKLASLLTSLTDEECGNAVGRQSRHSEYIRILYVMK